MQNHESPLGGPGVSTHDAARHIVQCDLIYDVGFNTGQDTSFYLARGYRVVAVEADPTLAEAGRRKFRSEVESGRLKIVNVGIGPAEGNAEFWISEGRPHFNSFHREIAARDDFSHHAIQVPTTRFSTILERYGIPHYLKIDIEGNDALCLDDLNPDALPEYVSTECECPSGMNPGPSEGLQLLDKLYSLGYRQFKLIDQNSFCDLSLEPSWHQRVDEATIRTLTATGTKNLRGTGILVRHLLIKRKLEDKFRWKFPQGSSGVWGEDTPGKWMDRDQAEATFLFYRRRHFERDSSASYFSFWCDWHAKL